MRLDHFFLSFCLFLLLAASCQKETDFTRQTNCAGGGRVLTTLKSALAVISGSGDNYIILLEKPLKFSVPSMLGEYSQLIPGDLPSNFKIPELRVQVWGEVQEVSPFACYAGMTDVQITRIVRN